MAILLAIFFFLVLKLPHFASVFWYTESQGDLFIAYFAVGSVIGAGACSFAIVAVPGGYRCNQIVFESLYVITIIFLCGFATYENFSLLCFFVLLLGVFLACLTGAEVYQLDTNFDNGTVPLALSCFGLYGCLLCLLGDFTYYINRDDPFWTYVDIAGTTGLVIIACLCTLPWLQKGCKCKSCCGCCEAEASDSD